MTTLEPRSATQPGTIVPGSRPPLSLPAMEALFRARLESKLLEATTAYGELTVTVAPEAWVQAVRLCKRDDALSFEFFDWLSAVDAAEAGFLVVCHLYSVSRIQHVTLRTLAPGGREAPRLSTVTGVYRGANWHERETYDMFGVLFDGHPSLLPRILTVENFEGFPLRKEFRLTTRDAKPWPGAKEPEEQKEAGEEGAPAAAAAGPEDKAAAAKAKAERAKKKAAEARARKAAERAAAESGTPDAPADSAPTADAPADGLTPAADEPDPQTPEGAAEIADSDIAKDAAAGAVAGDTARGAPGDVPGVDEPVPDAATEAEYGEGDPGTASGTPGVEVEGRHAGAVEQSGDRPAADTPGMTADEPAGDAARDQHETPAPGPESDQSGDDAPEPGTDAPRTTEPDADDRRESP